MRRRKWLDVQGSKGKQIKARLVTFAHFFWYVLFEKSFKFVKSPPFYNLNKSPEMEAEQPPLRRSMRSARVLAR